MQPPRGRRVSATWSPPRARLQECRLFEHFSEVVATEDSRHGTKASLPKKGKDESSWATARARNTARPCLCDVSKQAHERLRYEKANRMRPDDA